MFYRTLCSRRIFRRITFYSILKRKRVTEMFFRRKNTAIKYLVVVIVLLLLLPWGFSYLWKNEQRISIEGDNIKIRLIIPANNELKELGLEEYVVGVVAAEMPASFPLEALKAQAVAARTYAVKRLKVPDPRVKALNLQADISSDPVMNQAWISSEEMKKRWGAFNYLLYKKKITQAVLETKGKVLTYEGELIDPVYFASCGGVGTENSEEVWKFAIPYLRRVPCVQHNDKHREEVQVVSLKKIDQLFGTRLSVLPAAKMSGAAGIGVSEKSASGRVKVMTVGGKAVTGAELRTKLGLPSARFEWQVTGGDVKFTTRGYGHGVGMCQYGAAALAEAGKKFNEILTYYYTGVSLSSIK